MDSRVECPCHLTNRRASAVNEPCEQQARSLTVGSRMVWCGVYDGTGQPPVGLDSCNLGACPRWPARTGRSLSGLIWTTRKCLARLLSVHGAVMLLDSRSRRRESWVTSPAKLHGAPRLGRDIDWVGCAASLHCNLSMPLKKYRSLSHSKGLFNAVGWDQQQTDSGRSMMSA